MTIEEYLTNGVELEEMAMAHFERPSEDEEQRKIALAYSEGRHDVFKETLEKLSTFNHEVTLREIQEMCNNDWVDGSECDETSCCLYENHFLTPNCPLLLTPPHWDIYNIQKRMKEARK